MARRKSGLSPRHKKILAFLEEYQQDKGYPPSIREIGDHTQISSTSVVKYYLNQLEEMGYIERQSNVSRGINPIKNAGGSLLPSSDPLDQLYALRVHGDSMIDAMVNDGDIVVMKKVDQARNGEMVAIWLADRDETTLKYFYQENGRVRLQPANPSMQPIIIDDPSIVEVQGKVVLVIRQLENA